jgi:hypothetical protein
LHHSAFFRMRPWPSVDSDAQSVESDNDLGPDADSSDDPMVDEQGDSSLEQKEEKQSLIVAVSRDDYKQLTLKFQQYVCEANGVFQLIDVPMEVYAFGGRGLQSAGSGFNGPSGSDPPTPMANVINHAVRMLAVQWIHDGMNEVFIFDALDLGFISTHTHTHTHSIQTNIETPFICPCFA